MPIVDRVHGGNHPEFHTVRQIFEAIIKKTAAAKTAKPDLSGEFAQLRAVTADYTVPGDVCETYEAVYKMLAEADQAYQAYQA